MTTIRHGIAPYSDGSGFKLTAIVTVFRDGQAMLELKQHSEASISIELSDWEHCRSEIDKAVSAFRSLTAEGGEA
jgi:hypothetical protein